jgi:hypothetical protein
MAPKAPRAGDTEAAVAKCLTASEIAKECSWLRPALRVRSVSLGPSNHTQLHPLTVHTSAPHVGFWMYVTPSATLLYSNDTLLGPGARKLTCLWSWPLGFVSLSESHLYSP